MEPAPPRPPTVDRTNLDTQRQRLNQLIEQISNQEAQLNRLKALRELAKEQTNTNIELSNQLKTVNRSICEKDGELKQALNRVDNLTKKLNYSHRRVRTAQAKGVAAPSQQPPLPQIPTPTTNAITSSSTAITSSNNNNASNSNNNNNNNNNHSLELTQKGHHDSIQQQQIDHQATTGGNNNLNNNNGRRVSFDPLALLLDAALEGELDLVIQTSKQVPDLNASHDECVTALHNASVAGHYDVAKYLIEAGCDINVQDSDGWTPLHCAASCNNLPLVKLLIENGASIYATTASEQSTPAMECEKTEQGSRDCYKYLISVQNNLGVIKNGNVYALFDYEAQREDELSFKTNEELTVLRRDDSDEQEWWWAQKNVQQTGESVVELKEGYIPRNLVGLHPRVDAYLKNKNRHSTTPINSR